MCDPAAAALAAQPPRALAFWAPSDPQLDAALDEQVQGELHRRFFSDSSAEAPPRAGAGRVVLRTCVDEAAQYEVSSCGSSFETRLTMTGDDGSRRIFSADGEGPCAGRAVKAVFLDPGCYRVALSARGAEEVEGAYSAYKYAMCKHACPTSWRLPI